MATVYEWDIEEWDDGGDVIDHNHVDKVTEDLLSKVDGKFFHLVLVRNSGNRYTGLIHRDWSYTYKSHITGTWLLPDIFDDGYKVPERFHVELAKVQ
jgi:hypothetical protein